MRQKIPATVYELIEREFTLGRELLATLAREQAAVVGLQMSELLALSRQKEEQIKVLREVDEQLRLLVEQLTGKASENAVRLSDLAELATGDERSKLEKLRKELVALRQEIAAKSVINHHYAEDTKRHLHEAITLLTTASVSEQPANYGKPGRAGRPATTGPSLISRSV